MQPRVSIFAALVVASSVVGLAGCEHAEFSLPSSRPTGTARASRAVAEDPAKVPSSSIFVLAEVDARRALVPFGCWNNGRQTLGSGAVCGAIVPPQATLRCLGGESVRLGAKVQTSCGEGYEIPIDALGCEVAVWVAREPAPDVILLPTIQPQTTADERTTLSRVAPSPLDIAQAITIDLDEDELKDRLYVARGAVLGTFGRAPQQPFVVERAAQGRFRVTAITDLDRDARPEIWLAMTDVTPGATREDRLERVERDGRVTTIASRRCSAPPASAPSATTPAAPALPAPPPPP